jgi:hypothetical protein
MYGGIVVLGDAFFTLVNVSDANKTSIAADAPPSFVVYGDTGILAGGTTVPVAGRTGLYSLSQAITQANQFARGRQYIFVVEYTINSAAKRQAITLTVT